MLLAGVGAAPRELTEHIPDIRNISIGGKDERLAARAILKDLVLPCAASRCRSRPIDGARTPPAYSEAGGATQTSLC